MNEKGSNHQLLKRSNYHLIKKCIYQNSPISRVEVAQKLSLTTPTITGVVTPLLHRGLLRETAAAAGEEGKSAGRPRVMLKYGGTRAGSTLTQDRALQNMLKWLPNTLEEILPTLTENPAREMGLWARKGSVETGKDADVVLLDEEANIVHVFARGRQVK